MEGDGGMPTTPAMLVSRQHGLNCAVGEKNYFPTFFKIYLFTRFPRSFRIAGHICQTKYNLHNIKVNPLIEKKDIVSSIHIHM